MAAHQALPSLGFSRQEHWSGLPSPSPMHESEKWTWSRSVSSDSWGAIAFSVSLEYYIGILNSFCPKYKSSLFPPEPNMFPILSNNTVTHPVAKGNFLGIILYFSLTFSNLILLCLILSSSAEAFECPYCL